MRARIINVAIALAAAALVAIIVAAIALATFGEDDSGSLADATVVVSQSLQNDVSVIDNEFEPQALRVPEGATVTWHIEGSLPHNVTAEDGTFESDTAKSGQFAWTFNDAGEHTYECTVHPGMSGVIHVGDDASATP